LGSLLAAVRRVEGPMPTEQPRQGERNIVINGVRLSDTEIAEIESTFRTKLVDGDFWYDRVCGAWGIQGGPAIGIILPGIALGGGGMKPDCSGGDTGVFINGRQLHRLDVAALMLLGPVIPGRYWTDAAGNFGFEGWPAPMGNFWALARQRAGGAQGGQGGAWTHYVSESAGGGMFSNDGQGGLYYDGPGGMSA
jgi:hypothetical protein